MKRWLAGLCAAVVVAAVGVLLVPDRFDLPETRVLGPTEGEPSAPPTDRSPGVPRQPVGRGTTLSRCAAVDPVDLTVLSFNIHAGRTKAGRLDLARVADEIEAWQPDLVLLQEVDRGRDRSGRVDQTRWLGRRLDMHAVFGPNRRLRGGVSGNAVLSRFPVVARANQPLPSRPGLYRRGLLRVTVDVSGQRVDVFATHLEHASRHVRREQARAVAERVQRSRVPVLVGGDLNAEPGTPPLRSLNRRGLVDPWPLVGRGPGRTVPAYDPRRRIDFLLADTSFLPVDATVLTSRVSDHRAVRVELKLLAPPCR